MASTKTKRVNAPKGKPSAKKGAAKSSKMAPAKKTAPKKAPAKNPVTRQAPSNEASSFAPLKLLSPSEHSDGWTLMLADFNSPVDVFEEEGHSGNGYAWDSVARVALRDSADHLHAIEFDSEAGTFVAMSGTKEPLLALGEALSKLLRDPNALRAAIRAVPEDDWDD